MKKILTYTGLTLAGVLLVVLFVTAKTYAQLGIAVALYPIIAFFALKTFPRKNNDKPLVTIHIPKPVVPEVTKTVKVEGTGVEINDIDKRTFLKLIGATGISFFLFQS